MLLHEKFGNLIVIKTFDRRAECRCACGTVVQVGFKTLRKGHIISCGCIANTERELYLWKDLYLDLKVRIKRFNRSDDNLLSFNEFVEKSKKNCVYCGKIPSNIKKDRLGRKFGSGTIETKITYSGLDRINPNLSYSNENTNSCCRRCNFAKNDATKDSFIRTARGFSQLYNLAIANEEIEKRIKEKTLALHQSLLYLCD